MNVSSYKGAFWVILTFQVILAQTPLFAQKENKKLSFEMKDASLEEFIKKIEAMSDFSFIFSEDIKISQKISIIAQLKTIEEVLAEAFIHEPVHFIISGKHILLQKKNKLFYSKIYHQRIRH